MATTMHFGPEWMRTKQLPQRTQLPPSPPPPVSVPPPSASTYSALVSPAPALQPEKHDEAHPFRYSKEEMLTIYKEGGGRGGLGLEVERWKGIVREVGSEPIGLREMGDADKKLFASSLNSDLRRRQSTDFLSPLSTQGAGGERPRLNNNSATSPMRERFGSLMRRKSIDQPPLITPRKPSLSSGQGPLNLPRDGSLPSPRTRIGPFDGVLNGGDSWVARRRASESLQKAGGRGESGNTEHQQDNKGSEIKEEEEEGGQGAELQTNSEETSDIALQPSPEPDPLRSIATAGPPKESMPPENQALNTGIEHLSISDETSSSPKDGVDSAAMTAPPPGIDLASIEWSYLDPQGQVQGPFRADLMQTWYDGGYFTLDLLMKRTHLDAEWTALGELSRRSGGNKIFLSLPNGPPVPPPGLSRQTESPNQGLVTPVDQNAFNAPYQPAPIRSLRASTLDSYLGTASNPSDSPSSSFGGGRFGNGSPDPAAFGGRVGNNSYPLDPPVGGRTAFSAIPEPSVFTRRNAFNDPSLEPSLTFRSPSFGNLAPSRASTVDAYGVDGAHSSVQAPWSASPSNPVGSTFDGINGGRSSTDMGPFSSNFSPSLNQAPGYGNVRVPQDTTLHDANSVFPASEYSAIDFGNQQDLARSETDDKNPTTPSFSSYTNGHGHTSFSQGQQYAHPPSAPYAAPQQHQSLHTPAGAFGHHDAGTQKTIPQLTGQYSHYPSHATTAQSPWNSHETSTGRRPGPFDPLHPTSTNTAVHRPVTPSQPTPWGRSSQNSRPASLTAEPSPWFAASQGIVEDSWKETPGPSNLTFSNVGQHNQLQQVLGTPVDSPTVPVLSDQSQQQPLTESVPATAPTPAATKSRRKSTVPPTQPPSAPTNTAPPITATPVVKSSSPPASVQPKLAAWSNEDEPRAKPSGATLSLRDIQEAEARKMDARKAAERERERAARAVAPAPVVNEESQAFTASWGLPTSQAGAARNNVQQKEVSVAPSATVAVPPVWINSTKSQPTKKSMKEIQEEEERRKKTASKEAAASSARRAYAESTNKVGTPLVPAVTSAWTTVGPSGKNATGIATGIAAAARPSTGMSASSSTPRANGSTGPRLPAASAVKTSTPRIEDHPVAPSHDFLRWLSDSLKGLNASVNVEEIMSMLLSFPMDPDPSTAELISEMIYANSTTLDGRRFASEFVSKRKMDAASRPKVAGAAGLVAKPVSIADVVKAQPKPAQQEWGGFKVVNKKKKGGR